jgi:lipoprotein-anchoring transpeptidase ErfK/SrfK
MSLCPALQAQNRVVFSYDAAGNRISRTIVLAPRSTPVAEEEEKQEVLTEMLADIKVKIYPNPTTGLVTVEISNLPKGETANIWLYAMAGQLIGTYKDAKNVIRVDISNRPAGVYVMKIVAGKRQTEWKIIKK